MKLGYESKAKAATSEEGSKMKQLIQCALRVIAQKRSAADGGRVVGSYSFAVPAAKTRHFSYLLLS